MPGTPSGNCREDDGPFDDEPFDPRTLLVDDPGDGDEPWPGYPFSPENAPPDGDEAFLADLPSELAQEYLTVRGPARVSRSAAGFVHRQARRPRRGRVRGGRGAGRAGAGAGAGRVRPRRRRGRPGPAGAGESELIGFLCAARADGLVGRGAGGRGGDHAVPPPRRAGPGAAEQAPDRARRRGSRRRADPDRAAPRPGWSTSAAAWSACPRSAPRWPPGSSTGPAPWCSPTSSPPLDDEAARQDRRPGAAPRRRDDHRPAAPGAAPRGRAR